MGHGPQFNLGPPYFLREGLRVIFCKNSYFFNFPFFPTKHINHTIQFTFKIIVSHQEKQAFEVKNKQSRISKQVPTQNCLRSLSYIILCIYIYAKPTYQAE